ncbi:hypothetical protein LAM21_22505, partial [Mycobacterium tuberculosis]|nr:hypothetical protein [Mycobacterium tuberculosis]
MAPGPGSSAGVRRAPAAWRHAHSRSLQDCGFQSLAAAVFPEAGSEAGAACAVALVATPIAPAPAPPITTVGISAIDFT